MAEYLAAMHDICKKLKMTEQQNILITIITHQKQDHAEWVAELFCAHGIEPVANYIFLLILYSSLLIFSIFFILQVAHSNLLYIKITFWREPCQLPTHSQHQPKASGQEDSTIIKGMSES